MKPKHECEDCKEKNRRAKIKIHKGKMLCFKCYSKCANILVNGDSNKILTRLEQEIKKTEEKIGEGVARKLIKPQRIRGSKERKLSKNSHHYLTSIEKEVLYKKYLSTGIGSDLASRKVKQDVEFLRLFKIKLKEMNLSDEETNLKFKEEFAKLIK